VRAPRIAKMDAEDLRVLRLLEGAVSYDMAHFRVLCKVQGGEQTPEWARRVLRLREEGAVVVDVVRHLPSKVYRVALTPVGRWHLEAGDVSATGKEAKGAS